MARRLIKSVATLSLVFISAILIRYATADSRIPIPPEPPPDRVVRGAPSDGPHAAWANEVLLIQSAGLTGAAITVDSDTVMLVGGLLTIASLLFAGLSKILVKPMIRDELSKFAEHMDEKFIPREVVMNHFKTDEEIQRQLNARLDELARRIR